MTRSVRLTELIKSGEYIESKGDIDRTITSLTLDSRSAAKGSLFFAVCGTAGDGHDHIADAVRAGAAAVICQHIPENADPAAAYIVVEDSSVAAGILSGRFYGEPSNKIKLVGVTGTNGKTTTATLLYDLFRGLGYKVGLISTVAYCIDRERMESTHTTPDAIRLNRMLAQMVDVGCEFCFMEVSSHSLVQNRTAGLKFTGGIFTNLTHDHLDYHGSLAEYLKAKKKFFDLLPKGSFALTNKDDRNGRIMVQNTRAQVYTYSLRSPADFMCRIVETHFDGMLLSLDSREVWVNFIGRFNAYNLTSVYAAAVLLGAERNEALQVLSTLTPVTGRFETVRSAAGVTAIIDYAHTPDALSNVIETINEIRRPEQKLIIVAGCGGNRDAAKRPVMGRIAAEGGDIAILTSDNPRMENPDAIIEQMKSGIPPGRKYIAITDRRQAISAAAAMAADGDIILITGKGHETYQDMGGVKSHFDDKEEITAAFAKL